ncbi:hypothetical protein GGR56DRAFT_669089 [Xylariaceae sp. FL0804]|nr:hypothetical protein GGR56DRAFT_669089 [Xylariaceae sp. FL0804]
MSAASSHPSGTIVSATPDEFLGLTERMVKIPERTRDLILESKISPRECADLILDAIKSQQDAHGTSERAAFILAWRQIATALRGRPVQEGQRGHLTRMAWWMSYIDGRWDHDRYRLVEEGVNVLQASSNRDSGRSMEPEPLFDLFNPERAPPATFTLFPRLPPEIRIMIWRHSLHRRRILSLGVEYIPQGGNMIDKATRKLQFTMHKTSQTYSKLLSVNFEARTVALEFYRYDILETDATSRFPDTVFDPSGWFWDMLRELKALDPRKVGVLSLAIPNQYLSNFMSYTSYALAGFSTFDEDRRAELRECSAGILGPFPMTCILSSPEH